MPKNHILLSLILYLLMTKPDLDTLVGSLGSLDKLVIKNFQTF